MADDRKKRGEAPTVPKMKARKGPEPTAAPTTAPTTARPPRPSRPAKGRLVEEIGERVRRDPRRESE